MFIESYITTYNESNLLKQSTLKIARDTALISNITMLVGVTFYCAFFIVV